jgi:hypothetical protein
MKPLLIIIKHPSFKQFFWPATILFVFFISSVSVVAVHGMSPFERVYQNAPTKNGAINPELRQRWMEKTVEKLQEIDAGTCLQSLERRVVDLDDFFMVAYRLNGPEGCIEFPNGDWVYMVAHSLHDNPAIGDITIAIDNHQRLYKNEGHVCGGIINFYTGSEEDLLGAGDFFGNFMSDCDDCKWYRINQDLQKLPER